jgi:hypothetical protein
MKCSIDQRKLNERAWIQEIENEEPHIFTEAAYQKKYIPKFNTELTVSCNHYMALNEYKTEIK